MNNDIAGNRYATLDGMRGVAALAVVLSHIDPRLARHGHMAVDFFFALSAFILTTIYTPRLSAGLRWWAFIRFRLIRLYPLFLLGLLFGTMQLAAIGQPDLWRTTLFNLALLPSPYSQDLFPANLPAWTLSFELLANLLLVPLLGMQKRFWIGAISVSAFMALLLLAASAPGPLPLARGFDWDGIVIAIARTAFSFTLGIVIARKCQGATRLSSIWAIPAWAALAIALTMPVPKDWALIYNFAFLMLISPALLIIGSRIEPPAVIVPAALLAGQLSYPIYALHMPILGESWRVGVAFGGVPRLVQAAISIGLCGACAWAAMRCFDIPLRRMLTRRFQPAK